MLTILAHWCLEVSKLYVLVHDDMPEQQIPSISNRKSKGEHMVQSLKVHL